MKKEEMFFNKLHRKGSQTQYHRGQQLTHLSTTSGGRVGGQTGSQRTGQGGHHSAPDFVVLWECGPHGARASSFSREVGKADLI